LVFACPKDPGSIPDSLIMIHRSPYRTFLSVQLLPAALGALLIATGVGAPTAGNAQSFDCRHARYADEKMICRQPLLGQLDEELASIYRRILLNLPRAERGELDRNEDAFVIARRRCGADRACIEQSYRRRIRELQAALPKGDPDRSARHSDSKHSDRQKVVCLAATLYYWL
jgi:uncharacterized protein